MELVNLQQPKRIVFGDGALQKAAEIADLGVRRVLLVTSTPIVPLVRPQVEALEGRGVSVTVFSGVDTEPSVSLFETVLEVAQSADPDAVVGIGSGQCDRIEELTGTIRGFLNWQGVLNTAFRLRGEHIFTDLLDSPERARHVLTAWPRPCCVSSVPSTPASGRPAPTTASPPSRTAS